jgi:hypothetical protein
VKTYSNVELRNDFEHHVIHRRAFVDPQEYHIYDYVESYEDGKLPPSHQRAMRRHQVSKEEQDRHDHDDYAFDDRRPGIVVSCKVARRFGFYIYTAFLILVSITIY